MQAELDDCIEKKKAKLDIIKTLAEEADKLAQKAEARHDLTLLTKSNALREKSKSLTKELPSYEKDIAQLKAKL